MILGWYEFLVQIPLIGRWLFSVAVSFSSPYTGSLPFSVSSLNGQGHATLTLRDSWFIRNPFSCIHAAALTNLGEATGGLAMLCLLESTTFESKPRAIVSRLESIFYKKATGRITATVDIPQDTVDFKDSSTVKEIPVKALLCDASGSVVASVTAHWSVRSGSKELVDKSQGSTKTLKKA